MCFLRISTKNCLSTSSALHQINSESNVQNKISSDDHLTPPPSISAGNYMQTSHMSPIHNVNNPQSYHHQSHQSHQSHFNSTGTLTPLTHSTHQQQSQLIQSNDNASVSNIPVSVSVNPMQPSRSTTPKK